MTKVTNNNSIGMFQTLSQSLAKQRNGNGTSKSDATSSSQSSPFIQDQITISRPAESVAQAFTKGMREHKFTTMKEYGAYVVQLYTKLTKGDGQG